MKHLSKFIAISLLGFSNFCTADTNHFYFGGGLATLIASDTLRLYRPTQGVFHTTHDMGNSYGGQIFFGVHRMLEKQKYIAGNNFTDKLQPRDQVVALNLVRAFT